MRRWAAFLDRDGTLVEEAGHLSRPEDLKVIDGAPAAVKRLSEAGAVVVVVTNQPVVARGMIDEAGLKRVHERLEELFAVEGARFDAIYYCPHHPEKGHPEAGDPDSPSERRHGGAPPRQAGDPVYRRECDCRKPKPGMVFDAASKFGVDLARSYLVGDTTRDMLTAKNAGCTGVLVETGYGGKDGLFNARPDAVCADLAAAADWILERAR